MTKPAPRLFTNNHTHLNLYLHNRPLRYKLTPNTPTVPLFHLTDITATITHLVGERRIFKEYGYMSLEAIESHYWYTQLMPLYHPDYLHLLTKLGHEQVTSTLTDTSTPTQNISTITATTPTPTPTPTPTLTLYNQEIPYKIGERTLVTIEDSIRITDPFPQLHLDREAVSQALGVNLPSEDEITPRELYHYLSPFADIRSEITPFLIELEEDLANPKENSND